MDEKGNIYRSDDAIAEDVARLDGFLKARAEVGEHEREKAAFEKALAEMKESQGEGVG